VDFPGCSTGLGGMSDQTGGPDASADAVSARDTGVVEAGVVEAGVVEAGVVEPGVVDVRRFQERFGLGAAWLRAVRHDNGAELSGIRQDGPAPG
jgi:hypothetical protein